MPTLLTGIFVVLMRVRYGSGSENTRERIRNRGNDPDPQHCFQVGLNLVYCIQVQAQQLSMIAGGTGITPMLQLIRAVFRLDQEPQH
jgi:hypothetical protein